MKQRGTIRKSAIDALPIANMDQEAIFQMKSGLFFTSLLLKSTDINALNADERMKAIGQFTRFNTNYIDPYKIISMRFPADTKAQQRYWRRRIQQAKTTLQKERAQETLLKLKQEEVEKSNQEYYLCIFGKTVKELERNYQKVMRLSDYYVQAQTLPPNKLIQIQQKLANLNQAIGTKGTEN